MRRHGWGGDLPKDEDEVRSRIIEAAMTCVEELGPGKTNLAAVAAELRITRQTVYRYYPSTEDLFAAVAEVAAERFMTGVEKVLRDTLAKTGDPVEALIEAVVYSVEHVPKEPLLNVSSAQIEPGRAARLMASAEAVEIGSTAIRSLGSAWESLGFGPKDLDELTEVLERTVQSLLMSPSEPPRSRRQLRAFLNRWLGPYLRSSAKATALT